MAFIDIDIEEHIDEVDTDILIEEIKKRKPLKESVCDLLGLNYLASNEDIVEELLNKI